MEIIIGAVVCLGVALALAFFAIMKLMFWAGPDDIDYQDDRFWGSQDIDRRRRHEAD